jgi:integrase
MGLITTRDLAAKATGKDQWITDDAPKGAGRFCARITGKGERLFYFRYTTEDGKREIIALGQYDPDGRQGLTLEAARTRAGELSKLYQAGNRNLREHLDQMARIEQERRDAEEARFLANKIAAEAEALRIANRRTVESAARLWFEHPGKRSRKPKSEEIRRRFECDVFPLIGAKALEDVNKGDVRALLGRIEARGSLVMAQHMAADLRQFFTYCVTFDWIATSPAETIKKSDVGAKAKERERVLSEAELRALPAALEASGLIPATQAAIWIMLATCCRVGELSKARWANVDMEARVWTIPATDAKNRREHRIQLSNFAVKHFNALRDLAPKSVWVLPSEGGDGHIDTKTIAKQIADRQRSEGDEPLSKRSKQSTVLLSEGGRWTPHDLRRTGATQMKKSLRISSEVIERCLNHLEQNRMKRIYQRDDYAEDMGHAWVRLGNHLERLTTPVDNVVPLMRHA